MKIEKSSDQMLPSSNAAAQYNNGMVPHHMARDDTREWYDYNLTANAIPQRY